MFKKAILATTSLTFAAALSIGFGASNAFANKVDCTKVMSELGAGKKSSEVAKDQNISTSSVYRCKQKAGATTKASDMKSSAPKPMATMAAKPMATAAPMHK